MARGWESKSVEDQISEREAERQDSGKRKASPLEIERKSKRAGILLVRSRTVTALESTRDERYRTLLQRTLEYLDSQLSELDKH